MDGWDNLGMEFESWEEKERTIESMNGKEATSVYLAVNYLKLEKIVAGSKDKALISTDSDRALILTFGHLHQHNLLYLLEILE